MIMERYSLRLFTILLFMAFVSSPVCAGEVPSFVLGPGDVLEISVWKDPELTKQVIVQPDGYLSFPLVGQVKAGGKTLAKVQHEIVERLQEYIPSPTVAVLPFKIESYKVYVIGKVKEPGVFMLPEPINVMQALSLAGGMNPFADLDKITILRQGPDGQSRIRFDYGDVAKGKHLEQNIMLQTGDVVVVP
ncbi:MAG: polysaccharide biosynthesis/export family protein [Deltaproteobacteria bacterium]|nr:polysaccharide biosynthesis/export family protein [Deltaproteobacteria bacterium]